MIAHTGKPDRPRSNGGASRGNRDEPDRTRRFTLPRIQDLSKDQEAALALPLEGQHLIIGGPGTGKSVVALLRARRLARQNRKYLFLVYNRLLNQSNLHLFGSDERLQAATWDRWFRQQWKQLMSADVPTLAPRPGNSYRPIDWPSVQHATFALDAGVVVKDPPFLVIDEGQDMPPQFYAALISFGFENFYVVADQNQQIFPDRCSSRQDIEITLGCDTTDTLELKRNYRNTYAIAGLAREFYTGDPAAPPPDLPAPSSSTDTPRLVTHSNEGFQQIIDRILKICDRNPRKLIGILTANNTVRSRWVATLQHAQPTLDHCKAPVSTYASGQDGTLDFGHGGIMVINAQSCKGLEFEIVFLADIDSYWAQDETILRSLFYVMVARARERVFLLRDETPDPKIEAILPNDSAILERR